MLDYTKMAIRQTIADLKRVDYIRNVATQIVYIVYLIYNLAAGAGYLALNIVLLVLAAAYFVFFLTVTSLGKTPEGKTLKKTGTAVYVWCRRLIKLFTLGLTVYGICTAVGHVSALSVILAALMIVGWCLQIIFEVLIKILTNRVNFILEGLEADLDNMLRPVRSVGNFFKKIAGKEVKPEKELTKNQLRLKEKVEAYRAEQKRKKAEEKIRREVARTAAKQSEKERLKREKRSVRIENKLLKAAKKREKEDEQNTKILPVPAESSAEPAPAAPYTDAESAVRPTLSARFRRWLKGEPLSPEREVFEDSDAEERTETEGGRPEEIADEDMQKALAEAWLSEEEKGEISPEGEYSPGEETALSRLSDAPAENGEHTEAETAEAPKKKKGFFRSLFGKK